MDKSDAYDQALVDHTESIAHDMRLGEYGDDLLAEILRMLLSKSKADEDAVQDMTLSDIIERAAEIRASSEEEEENVGELAMEIMQDAHDSAGDAAYERQREARWE